MFKLFGGSKRSQTLAATTGLDEAIGKIRKERKDDRDWFRFLRPPPKHLYCPFCKKIYDDPVKLSCSHSLCKNCLEEIMQEKNPECPVCHDDISPEVTDENLIPSYQLSEEVKTLVIYCPHGPANEEDVHELFKKLTEGDGVSTKPQDPELFRRHLSEDKQLKRSATVPNFSEDEVSHLEEENRMRGCTEITTVGTRHEHEQVCPFAIIPCDLVDTQNRHERCQHRTRRSMMPEHRAQCDFRTRRCPNESCHRQVSIRSMKQHEEECQFKLVECPNGCLEIVTRIGLENHMHRECIVSCDFSSYENLLQSRNYTEKQKSEITLKKLKYQSDQISKMQTELLLREQQRDLFDGEPFDGVYFMPKHFERNSAADKEWLNIPNKSKKNYQDHLNNVLTNDGHPMGKLFGHICSTIVELSQGSKKHPENYAKIRTTLQQKTDILYKALVTTWPIMREWMECKDFVYHFAIGKTFPYLFGICSSKYEAEEKALTIKIDQLANITPEILGIKPEFCIVDEVDGGLVFSTGAVSILREVREYRSLRDKLNCLVATVQLISNSVVNYVTATALVDTRKSDFTVSADDLLPMLVYVIIQAKLMHMYIELRFIFDFGNLDSVTSGQTGYCLSMFEGALEHIITMPIPENLIPEIIIPPLSSSGHVTPRKLSSEKSPSGTPPEFSPNFPDGSLGVPHNSPVESPPASPKSGTRDFQLEHSFGLDDDISVKFTASYPSMTKKGMLYLSENFLHFSQGRGDRLSIHWYDIYSIKKAKYGLFDNAIEVLTFDENIKRDKDDKFQVEIQDEKRDLRSVRFLNVENRNGAWTHMNQFHQSLSFKLNLPFPFVIKDVSVNPDDVDFEVDVGRGREGLSTGQYDCRDEDLAVALTACLCQLNFGDYNPGKYKAGYSREAKVNRLIPCHWKSTLDENWLTREWARIACYADTNVKCHFLEMCRDIVRKMMRAYGLSIFFVKENQDKKLHTRIVGISREAILRLNPENLEVEQQNALLDYKDSKYDEDLLKIQFKSGELYQISTVEGVEIVNAIETTILNNAA